MKGARARRLGGHACSAGLAITLGCALCATSCLLTLDYEKIAAALDAGSDAAADAADDGDAAGGAAGAAGSGGHGADGGGG